MDGFTEVMHKFYPTNFEVVEKIRQQLPMYQFQEGRFGWKFAKTSATKPNNPGIKFFFKKYSKYMRSNFTKLLTNSIYKF